MKFLDRYRLDYDLDVKSLPSQETISLLEYSAIPTVFQSFYTSYDSLEVVRRGIDVIVDLASEVDVDIRDRNSKGMVDNIPRAKALNTVLNIFPNEDEGISLFRRNIYSDLLLTGNAFLYWDGAYLYHVPSANIRVVAGKNKKIAYFEYMPDETKYYPNEMIHIQDNSVQGKLVGSSRLLCTRNTIKILYSMLNFQNNFFKNGAVPGLVLTTPNILGKKIKEKLLEYWQKVYSPSRGGRTPLILDGDFKLSPITSTTFKELDFESSISGHETKILKALGVPPVLLDGGNQANIAPNLKLLYITTVTPLVKKVTSALEAFFAYDLKPDVTTVAALKPELRDQANYFSSLVNTGIITANEAREQLRMDAHDDEEADTLRVPANIAGSAAVPSDGGKPTNNGDNSNG